MCRKWENDVSTVPKLRFYNMFKKEYKTEKYVQLIRNRKQRSVMAQTRCGILPLSIETGRYQDVPIEYRYCLMCDDNVVESESHFLLHCQRYAVLRFDFYNKIRTFFPRL